MLLLFNFYSVIICLRLKNKTMQKKHLVLLVATLLSATALVAYFLLKNNDTSNSTDQYGEMAIVSEMPATSEEAKLDNIAPEQPDNGNASVADSDAPVEVTDDGTSSGDGRTTVYSPNDGSTITDGTVISGNTENESVFYRIIDNQSGVIGEGPLTVKSNGDFSGTVSISSSGSEGRLDIYSKDDVGREISEVYIDVRFE